MKKVLVSLLLVALVASVASAELRAWYKLDEGSGTVVADSSGNGFDATLNGGGIWGNAGAVGTCLSNNRAWGGTYVDVPAAVFANASDQLTIAFWVNRTSNVYDFGAGGYMNGANAGGKVVGAGDYISGDAHYATFNGGDSTTKWWWGYGGADGTGDDEWHHMAYVWDFAAGTETVYCNGQVGSSQGSDAGDSFLGLDAFRFFTRTNSGGNSWWDSYHGEMDEFMIYDNALTEAEVMALVPEPMTIALLGLGGIALIRRKK